MCRLLVFLIAWGSAHADTGVYAGLGYDFHILPSDLGTNPDFIPGIGGRVGVRRGPFALEGSVSWGQPHEAHDSYFWQRSIELKVHVPLHRYFSTYGRMRWTRVDAEVDVYDREPLVYEGTGWGMALGAEFHGKSPIIALVFPWLTGTELPVLVRRGGLFLEVARDQVQRPQAYWSKHDLRAHDDRFWTVTLGWTWGTSS